MSSMVDSYRPQPQHYDAPPRRKPIPAPGAATRTQTLSSQQLSLHNRSRTSSSSVFPQVTTTTSSTFTYNNQQPPPVSQPPHSQPPALPALDSRRTLSNATTSSASTNMSLAQTNPSLHRTPSNRSGNSPTSYVSLMRKQKATVWCDRAQHEDPRLMEQRRQAKMRAVAEVVGGSHRSSTSTASINSSVRSKIRHHGVPKATRYIPANMSGTGVPMRLSATEVDEADSDDESNYQATPYHHRTNSGRSSLGSGPRVSYPTHSGRFSTSSTPPSGQGISPPEDKTEDETPVPGGRKTDYFATPTGLSTGSGSSGEREFGGLGQMPESTPRNVEETKKSTDELRRRGSVDDRSMTMSGNVRLFVANPDLSD